MRSRLALLALAIVACAKPAASTLADAGGPLAADVHAVDLPARALSPYDAHPAPPPPRAFRPRSLDADLPADPVQASRIRQGARIFGDTKREAPAYATSALSCRSCHLDGGQREGALPLRDVEAIYPAYQRRANRAVTLEERIQGCFERSENGAAPSAGSDVLEAVAAYIRWLAADAPRGVEPRWRARNHLDESSRVPIAALHVDRGAALYATRCASCHGADGQGELAPDAPRDTPIPPPLWGPRSFNDGAGFARVYTLAGFVRWAMPPNAPGTLSDADAQDVAAYIDSKDRPFFARKGEDFPDAGPPEDAVYYPGAYPKNPLKGAGAGR